MSGGQITADPVGHDNGGFFSGPETTLGWCVGALALATIAIAIMSPVGMIVCGSCTGVLAVVALLRNHERSWVVWLGAAVGLVAVVYAIAVLVVPR